MILALEKFWKRPVSLKRDGLKFFCETISGDADGKVPVLLSDQASSEIMDIIKKNQSCHDKL